MEHLIREIIFINYLCVKMGQKRTYKQYNESIFQSVYAKFKAQLGGVVFRIERTTDLPNIFGNAEIWGGKIKKGLIGLRYKGMAEKGKLIFNLVNIKHHSDETAFSRYLFGQPTISKTVIPSQIRSSVNAFETKTTLLPHFKTQFIASYTIEFITDAIINKHLLINKLNIRTYRFDTQSFQYLLYL